MQDKVNKMLITWKLRYMVSFLSKKIKFVECWICLNCPLKIDRTEHEI